MPDPRYVLIEALLRAVEARGRPGWRGIGPIPDQSDFSWLPALTAVAAPIRAESAKLIAGLRPADSRSLNDRSVGVTGSWQLVPLVDRNGPYPYARQLPVTVAALATVPGLRAADLAVLTAGSSIEPHCGNNWGVLRAHLVLVEPAGDAACALRFPDHDVVMAWCQDAAFVFDDAFRHDAVNARATDRLVLLLEFDRPLSRVLSALNALVQRLYRYHPVQRGVRGRVLARYAP